MTTSILNLSISGMSLRNNFEDHVDEFFDALQESDFEYVGCPFCVRSTYRQSLFHKKTLRIERCDCGMVYNSRQPKQEILDKFYKESDAMKDWSVLKTTLTECKRQDQKFDLAVRLLKNNVKSILDIGCGTGYFLSKFPQSIRRVGIDSHQGSLDVASDNKIETYNSGIDDYLNLCLKEKTKFDAVSMWGVLEHVKNPLEVLINSARITKKNGYVLVCVPNYASAVISYHHKKTFTFQPVHLWYFTISTLKRAFSHAGINFVDTWTIEPEARPVIRGINGFSPYDRLPQWLEDQLFTQDALLEYEKQIISANQGYKIVMLGKKT